MKSLELAALLCSRVCHDLISPVGALTNGLEVLADNPDEEMQGHALALIGSSAAQASAKLQFARLAFGAASSHAANVESSDAEAVARGLFSALKVTLDWRVPPLMLAKDEAKLLLNLVLLASESVPRGGAITASLEAGDPAAIIVSAEGKGARLGEGARAMLAEDAAEENLDPRSVQPFLVRLLAEALGRRLVVTEGEGRIVLATARAR